MGHLSDARMSAAYEQLLDDRIDATTYARIVVGSTVGSGGTSDTAPARWPARTRDQVTSTLSKVRQRTLVPAALVGLLALSCVGYAALHDETADDPRAPGTPPPTVAPAASPANPESPARADAGKPAPPAADEPGGANQQSGAGSAHGDKPTEPRVGGRAKGDVREKTPSAPADPSVPATGRNRSDAQSSTLGGIIGDFLEQGQTLGGVKLPPADESAVPDETPVDGNLGKPGSAPARQSRR
jgi:hypothetical protein